MEDIYDIAIIGSGPGGLSAAIYSGRYARKTIVISKDSGGTAAKAGDIENWPGIKKINGLELMNSFREHAKEYGVEFLDKNVENITKKNNLFYINLSDKSLKSRSIILSLGTKIKKLNIPGEEEFIGKGVSYCATCDAMFFRNKDVAVIGGADSACKSAVYLGEICKSVRIIYRGEKLRGEPIYLKKIKDNPKIEVIYQTTPVEIKGDLKVKSILIQNKSGEKNELKIDGVFFEIGTSPDNQIIDNLKIKTDQNGFIIVGRDMITNTKGVFAVGDMTNTPLKQIVTAAGEGAVAAKMAHDYLQELF
jgi:thioredoxin reductase (NADPH)